MTLTMLDDIYVSNLPSGADAYLGYTSGWWPTFDALVAKFPGAHLLSCAISASEDAECLDVETGDAVIAQIYGWFTRQQARGVWRPVIYHSAYQMNAVVATMTANGFARSDYRLLSAHYEGWEHICGPASCGLVGTDCDGTQWTDTAPGLGGSEIDASVLADDFFAPAPAPQPEPAQEDNVTELDTTIASHPLLADPPGSKTMTLLSVAPEAAPCVVRVSFSGQGAAAKDYALSWGAGEVTIPVTGDASRLDVVSGGGLPVTVRFS